MNKSRLKKLNIKGIMAIVLLGMMFVLIVGYFATKSLKPEKNKLLVEPASAKNEQTTDVGQAEEPTTQPDATPANQEEGETLPDGETTTLNAEPTTAKPKALIASINDETNWSLAIIGVDYPLPKDYEPRLANATTSSDIQLDFRITQYYQQMYDAAKQSGCILTPYSGYHSRSFQESTYTRKLNYYLNQGVSQQEAEALTNRKILPAGCSEHNAALCVDIVNASTDFANTKEYQWLLDNAQNYGFVLRYPEDKQDITGVDFQPWHWRFVGVENAQKMKESNQCLEEYLGIV